MKCVLSGEHNVTEKVKTSKYTVGTLFLAIYEEKEHIMLVTYDSIVSLSNPQCIWRPYPTMDVVRVLDEKEIVTLHNT